MKNIKYIGIRGHRGAGKNTIAYLLGSVLQYIHDNKISSAKELLSDANFNIFWRVICDEIIGDEHNALDNMNTPNVYLESFGYLPKMLIELLTDIPHEYIESDYYKDHVVVNLKDFSWIVDDNEANLKSLCSAQTVIEGVEREGFEPSTIYLSLREFIVYFATVCMKYLGKNVWVKAMRCTEDKNNEYEGYYNIGTQFKIFKDIKAPSELSYVKDHGGKIIKVSRPNNQKTNKGVEQLKDDSRWDYSIINTDILGDLSFRENLVKIAFELYEE